MKMISGLVRFNLSSPSGRNTFFVFAVILTVAVFLTGCNKSKPPVVHAAVSQDTSQATEDHTLVYQSPTVVAPAVVAPQAPAEPDFRVPDAEWISWIVGNRRPPKKFADFTATAGLPIPPPPAGKQ
jgi:hypothetical protein